MQKLKFGIIILFMLSLTGCAAIEKLFGYNDTAPQVTPAEPVQVQHNPTSYNRHTPYVKKRRPRSTAQEQENDGPPPKPKKYYPLPEVVPK